ncbi:XRE family transcriptional regulator [Devosia sp. Leaf420]|uniref:DUF5680 domain-containing protein n=1 Tax=Devosia sp. Leaf420 TaxID=1736374 RepID=UPI000712EA57|nr:DUF5680 domain-containing protein [Devosia sp. Leaf420]KQT49883.1 XRE family transcriptional regulator [Devosia sp. Leaf420]
MTSDELNAVIVRAKAATYVGGGVKAPASRPGSHDLGWSEGPWRYLDSYFGGTDFLGQEVVWHLADPVWAMNYYGYVIRPDLIDAERAGATIKGALTAMYAEGRFLGGFEWVGAFGVYRDWSEGGVGQFRGREVILVEGVAAYGLDYFGGLVRG